MKRLLSVIIIVTITMLLMAFSVHAEDATVTVSGNHEAHNGEFFIVTTTVNGTDLYNVSGCLNYPCDDIAIFEINPTNTLAGWFINFNYENEGVIYFNAVTNSRDTVINGPVDLFTVRFVIYNSETRSVELKTSDIVYSIYYDEEIISNQAEIDAKTAERNACGLDEECINSIQIPEPVKTTVQSEKSGEVEPYVFTSRVTRKYSDNTYLKSAEFKNAVISPVFNKITTKYTVQIDDIYDLEYNFVAESPSSDIQVSKEVNSQIIVTVTSENGNVSSYIFNIKRNGRNKDHNTEVDHMETNTTIIPGQLSSTTLYLLIALAVIAVAIICIGGYYVYQGSHVDVVDDQQ